MKKIQVLGTGCPKCKQLAENAAAAIEGRQDEYVVEKVTDIADIMAMGVMVTPALVVDGQVKVCGKVPEPDEIKSFLE